MTDIDVRQMVKWAKSDGWEGEIKRLRARVKKIPVTKRRAHNRAIEAAATRAEEFAANALAFLPELNEQGKLRAKFVAHTACTLAILIRSMKVAR